MAVPNTGTVPAPAVPDPWTRDAPKGLWETAQTRFPTPPTAIIVM